LDLTLKLVQEGFKCTSPIGKNFASDLLEGFDYVKCGLLYVFRESLRGFVFFFSVIHFSV